jgi:aminopeptidase
MNAMPFGQEQQDLMPGARNAVATCLAVQSNEHVTLIADRASAPVAASLGAALNECGCPWQGIVVEEVATRPQIDLPPAIRNALETTDVGILCIQPQPGELASRMAMVAIVERRQIRYAHMVGVNAQIMRQGMRSDYRLVDRLSDRLRERMVRASSLTVRSPGGTSFVGRFDPSLEWVKTSGIISRRYWSNLPAGEVFTTPASVDGTFVCDGTAGDYFNAKYGDLSGSPMRLEISGGRLKAVECARRDLEREFWDYCHTDENSDRIGELAFGTNYALTDFIGILLQDEKFPGVHIAFGDPYGNQTHAHWSSRTHVDVLTRQCDVWIDEDPVIAGGRYLMDHLGL